MAYGAQKVHVKFTSNRLTHFGGVYLFHLFLKQIGWRHLIGRRIKFEQRNTQYTISEQLFSLLYPIILGLSHIEISKMLGNNGVFKMLIGLSGFPNPVTLRRFLIRGSNELQLQLIRLHDRVRKYFIDQIVPNKKLLVDMDSTVCTIYGDQEGAVKGYNPRHRGKKSYHPLFCFESHSGTILSLLHRQKKIGIGRIGSIYLIYDQCVQLFSHYYQSNHDTSQCVEILQWPCPVRTRYSSAERRLLSW